MFIALIIAILIVGAIIAVLSQAPIDARLKNGAYIVAIVGLIVYALLLLQRSGVLALP